MNQCHVSKVSLHYITCQVNFKPAVIIWPKVVNALVATFLRGDEDLWEVRQGWAGSAEVVSDYRAIGPYNISHKN